MRSLLLCLCAAAFPTGLRAAEDPPPVPPVPPTRSAMKEALERAKKETPRLPLPPLTAEERAAQGDRPVINNARARQLYLPAELRGGDFVREPDPVLSLDARFKTMLFWVVSRANNCSYCLGHQEIKLLGAGMTEDGIAALDGDWGPFSPAERAALTLARRLTYDPHRLDPTDVERVRDHFNELQTLEIIFTVSNNNATNRWTGGLRLPPEADGTPLLKVLGRGASAASVTGSFPTFLTPTSAEAAKRRSEVAPLEAPRRPALPPFATLEARLTAARSRTPRFTLADEATARTVLAMTESTSPLPAWMRLLARFPKHGAARVHTLHAAESKGRLSPLLRAQLAWVCAREDRAWYALGQARARLLALGLTPAALEAFDQGGASLSAQQQAIFHLARTLTSTPHLVSDDEVQAVRKHLSPSETAEVVYHVANAAFFNRLTEAAALRLE